jgi:hypothetical protein
VKRVVPGEPEIVEVAYPRSTAENATSISAIQGATLRFRDAGVTHVLPFETIGAGVGTFFAQGAEQQKYYPRYGLTSGNGAQLLVDQRALAAWPAGRRARLRLAAAGRPHQRRQPGRRALQQRRAAGRGSGAVHREAFLAGAHALGGSFQSGLTFATRYSPAHHDGVAQVRPFGYTPACGCFRYTGASRAIN